MMAKGKEIIEAGQTLIDKLHARVEQEMIELADFDDISYSVQVRIIHRIYPDDVDERKYLDIRLRKLKDELSGPTPTTLERLLIERILTCWLEVNWYDSRSAAFTGSLQLGNYYQKRQDRAHRRYLSAVKALAQVRRLGLPAIQVNIGQHQVNALTVQAPRAIENVDTLVGEPVLGIGGGISQKALLAAE